MFIPFFDCNNWSISINISLLFEFVFGDVSNFISFTIFFILFDVFAVVAFFILKFVSSPVKYKNDLLYPALFLFTFLKLE